MHLPQFSATEITMNIKSCSGSVTSKILGFTALLFLVLLTASLAHSFLSEKKLAEEFTLEQTKSIADSYFDALNKLMLTGGMESRDELHAQIVSMPNVLAARVLRGEAINQQYGAGKPDEAVQDAMDQAALKGQ
jgi:methyl-accepting chemotaxis protein